MIALHHVCKSFDGGSTFAVRDLSLQIAEGETLVLLGSSGCGKSTTLKMINRLLEPTSGTIEINGQDVMRRDPVELRRSIGYVFQGIGLFPHLTVVENVEIVLRLLDWDEERRRKRGREMLELVGLPPEQYARRLPEELSGGQQQRVGVARALASDPDYLLMDEPFGALDALTRDVLQQELLSLKSRLKKTIVFVTHDIFEALTLGDRIAILHQGELQQVGTREEILGAPATPFVRNLFAKPAKQLAAFKDVLS
ncbi:MAG: glycine/betaine ABC transporter ATP-binding protein [Gemmatales bacterium]|nr:MAG: glycine/betaine ABC transporter ATP-binding protein [Gemmatales bacterium]